MRAGQRRYAVCTAVGGVMLLTACAGGAGQAGGEEGGTGVSVEPRADFSEYQEALADMPETTLVYQASAASPEGADAARALQLKENVEDASGGKITIDLVWGQAIAGYDEVHDALADGRIDLAYMASRDPAPFPVTSAFSAATPLLGASPLTSDLASNAAFLELAWNTEQMHEEFESHDLTPLHPVQILGANHALCGETLDSVDDWQGRQVRISNSTMTEQLGALGANPVSLAYVETYEGLQRNTVDCALASPAAARAGGTVEVAHNIMYTENVSFARGIGALAAGPSFDQLPLAAQQLIFDQMTEWFMTSSQGDLDASVFVAEQARELGGEMSPVDPESEKLIADSTSGLIDDEVQNGNLPDDFASQVDSAYEHWLGVAEELGLTDEGTYEDFDEWYDAESVDLLPFAEAVYERALLPHRPS